MNFKTLAQGFLLSLLFLASAQASQQNNPRIKNIIFMVGDGMGTNYMTAYRFFKQGRFQNPLPETLFDSILTGSVRTGPPEDPDQTVTDSASAASAYSTGRRTYNGSIATSPDRKKLTTVMQAAKSKGMRTGLITTSQINHATPAAFVTHSSHRKNYDEIADGFYDTRVDGKLVVDVMLGGGQDYFFRNDRNLGKEFANAGYFVTKNHNELSESDNPKVLGLFSKVAFPQAQMEMSPERPTLAALTKDALNRLDRGSDKGFFLLVEGSQIDWAGHNNDIVWAMAEMSDFEGSLGVVLDFAKRDGETLVVLTADHETGGMSLGVEKQYKTNCGILKSIKYPPEKIVKLGTENGDLFQTVKSSLGFPLTDTEANGLKKYGKKFDKAYNERAAERSVLAADAASKLKYLFDQKSHTGWTTIGHTGVDVGLYAFGPQKASFSGSFDNSEIGKRLFEMVNLASKYASKEKIALSN